MRIEATIASWEQQCCGDAHRIGESSTFTIFLMPDGQPEKATDATRTRFPSDRHDRVPKGRDPRTVTGVVRAIQAIECGMIPMPGHPGGVIPDPTKRSATALDRIPMSCEVHAIDDELEVGSPQWFWEVADEFVVTLDVPDDTRLPAGR